MGELVGGAQQKGPVLGVAGSVEPDHGKLVARRCGHRIAALQQMFDRCVQRSRYTADVAAELAGPVRLPLRYRTPANIAGGRKLVLS